jgi:transcriptional regulator with XRE-family HTH domain
MANEPISDPVLEFGREIRRRREALGLTLEQLSERCGITPNYIGTIENGKRDPSISTLQHIAHGLGVPLGELLGARPRLSPSATELARVFDQVVAEVQTAVLMLLRMALRVRRR